MPVPLICPVCHEPLDWGEKAVTCPKGHTFDLAREGYVNLYRTSRRPINQPGDTKEMLHARRAFLDTAWYQPLSDRINDCVTAYSQAAGGLADRPEDANILDAGCGEGYYLGRLIAHLEGTDGGLRWAGCGIDISKEAIRLAARRHAHIRWAVANTAHHVPCASSLIDVALCMFAPRFGGALRRIMTSTGLLIVVIPGEDHLKELTAVAMTSIRDTGDKENVTVERLGEHFHLCARHHITYAMDLDQPALRDLLRMTPIYWRSTRAAQERIQALEAMTVTASFVVLTFSPSPHRLNPFVSPVPPTGHPA